MAFLLNDPEGVISLGGGHNLVPAVHLVHTFLALPEPGVEDGYMALIGIIVGVPVHH